MIVLSKLFDHQISRNISLKATNNRIDKHIHTCSNNKYITFKIICEKR